MFLLEVVEMERKELWKRIGYTKAVLERFTNPRNAGKIENPDIVAKVGSVVCGDLIKLYVKVDEENRKIKDMKFESYGCASNIATSDVMVDLVKGKTLDEAKKVGFKDIVKALGGLPKIKYHCAVLSKASLDTAILKYEAKRGILKIDEKFVKKILKGVIDPIRGVDILTAGKVRDLKVEDGKITINLTYLKDEETAKYIVSDLKEAFSDLNIDLTINLKE